MSKDLLCIGQYAPVKSNVLYRLTKLPKLLRLLFKMRLKKYSFKQARLDLPKRRSTDNKRIGGKSLVIAGSYGKWGAAILCAEATARCGAGYTYIFDPKKNFTSFKNPDFLSIHTVKDFTMFQSISIGPGFSDQTLLKKLF